MPPKPKTSGDKNLKSKSPAEFFLDNKGIAGFENAGKSLYTTLREFIENSLDSAESIGVLPDVDIAVEEVTLDEYETKIGLKTHVRKVRVSPFLFPIQQVPPSCSARLPRLFTTGNSCWRTV